VRGSPPWARRIGDRRARGGRKARANRAGARDALYIKVKEGEVSDSLELREGLIVDP
jgi:hypothetical protein